MRFTITIDDALYAKALDYSDPILNKPSKIFQEALKTYVRVQASRRLAALGGTSPEMPDIVNHEIFKK
ncbi:type II toxin-antitoxin system VapB family antitoxin [Halomonas sp. KRD171]|uniref:type II toxin-antitoxin system VapB family antitoxin n=1 Tax=Halomonas sp. KRD171 TaxID=2729726 RepID=UPI0019CFD89D|nr:type II toxin-antitoxin system VapB family antitoxin [Halomonas sp. KRD171]